MADKSIPDHWAFDKNGENVINPDDARSLAPIGDYKGFGLGLMVDVLTSLLSNSPISKDIKPMFTSEISEKRYIDKSFFIESKFKKLRIQHVKEIINARIIEMLDYLFNEKKTIH